VGRHIVRLVSGVSLALGALALASSALAAGEKQVILLPTTGIVDQGMAQYLHDGIARRSATVPRP
jgi:membrane-bound ClpP family serine protease